MPRISFAYRFSVTLPAPAEAAFRWATDYAPDDWARMGRIGRRHVDRLADGTVLLTDRVWTDGRPATKQRLVRLDPVRRAWTNTHLTSPTRHSQFLYRIVAHGPRRSRLEFTGLQVEQVPRTPSRTALSRHARAVARSDAALWRRLARVMRTELAPRRR